MMGRMRMSAVLPFSTIKEKETPTNIGVLLPKRHDFAMFSPRRKPHA
jgi:hypothetical protein